jgi:hypothetical protein
MTSRDIDHCWAGTTASSSTLRIRVVRRTIQDQGPVVLPMGYLTSLPRPELPHLLQDWPWCPA